MLLCLASSRAPDSASSTWRGCEILSPATSGPALEPQDWQWQLHYELACSTTKNIQINLKLLQEVDFDLDAAHDHSLRSWAKMAARVNASLWTFVRSCNEG